LVGGKRTHTHILTSLKIFSFTTIIIVDVDVVVNILVCRQTKVD
jgi:hypothetical protein